MLLYKDHAAELTEIFKYKYYVQTTGPYYIYMIIYMYKSGNNRLFIICK